MKPEVFFEPAEPESIVYQFGTIYEKLTGFHAWLYRGMIAMYGESEAKNRFFGYFYRTNKSGIAANNTASRLG